MGVSALKYTYRVLLKAFLSILVTLLGIVTETKLSQEPKAPSPILVTLSGISIEEKSQPLNTLAARVFKFFGILTEVRPQPENAPAPILVTLSGITIDFKLEQPANKLLVMLFKFSLKVTLVNVVIPLKQGIKWLF